MLFDLAAESGARGMTSQPPPGPHQATLPEQRDQAPRFTSRLPADRAVHLRWLLHQVACGVLLTLGLILLTSQVVQVSQGASDFCQDYIAAQRLAQGLPAYLPLRL